MSVWWICSLFLLVSLVESSEDETSNDKKSKMWSLRDNNPNRADLCHQRCRKSCGGYCLYDTMRFRMACKCPGHRYAYFR